MIIQYLLKCSSISAILEVDLLVIHLFLVSSMTKFCQEMGQNSSESGKYIRVTCYSCLGLADLGSLEFLAIA